MKYQRWTNERVDQLIDGKGARVGDVFMPEGKKDKAVMIDWSGCKCPPVRVHCNNLGTGKTSGCGGCQHKPGSVTSKAILATRLRLAEASLARALEKRPGYTAWLLEPRAVGTKGLTQRWVGYRCPEGHEAEMALGNFASGRGCPTCAVSGYKPDQPGSVYVVAGQGWIKLGISNTHCLDARLADHRRQGMDEVFRLVHFEDGADAKALEDLWLEQRKRIPAERLPTKADLPDGYTEAAPDIPMVRRWIQSNLVTLAEVA